MCTTEHEKIMKKSIFYSEHHERGQKSKLREWMRFASNFKGVSDYVCQALGDYWGIWGTSGSMGAMMEKKWLPLLEKSIFFKNWGSPGTRGRGLDMKREQEMWLSGFDAQI